MMEHVKVYLIENELDEKAIREAITKLADWRINEPEAKLLLQFNAPPERAVAQKLIHLGVLSFLTTTASFVAPLVDRKQLVRDHGYGALELWLVAKYSIDSELTNQKFGFFCETLKQSNDLPVSKGVFHGH
jgi:hypothetical protein